MAAVHHGRGGAWPRCGSSCGCDAATAAVAAAAAATCVRLSSGSAAAEKSSNVLKTFGRFESFQTVLNVSGGFEYFWFFSGHLNERPLNSGSEFRGLSTLCSPNQAGNRFVSCRVHLCAVECCLEMHLKRDLLLFRFTPGPVPFALWE